MLKANQKIDRLQKRAKKKIKKKKKRKSTTSNGTEYILGQELTDFPFANGYPLT